MGLKDLVGRVRSLFLERPAEGHRIAVDRSTWESGPQRHELRHHRTSQWRATEDFTRQSAALFRQFGFGAEELRDRVVLDLGAGSGSGPGTSRGPGW